MSDSVACFLRTDGEVLLGRRRGEGAADEAANDADGSAESASDTDGAGVRDVVRAEVDEDPEAAAVDAVDRIADDAALVRAGGPVYPDGAALRPFLFDVTGPLSETTLDEAFAETEWVPPTELRRRETPPGRWRAYESVAPTVRSVAADDEHGSAYLSVRALEVLRDRAAVVRDEEDDAGAGEAAADELFDLAARLRRARPSMAALHNRVNRAVAESDGTPAGVERAARKGIERALSADADAASEAAERVAGGGVLTLSRSGTALSALREAVPRELFVAESRPGNEGVGVAEALAGDHAVTLHTDAAVAHVLREADVDAVLVGADTVLPDGSVVNKTGTRAAALAAEREGVPFYAVAASDKVATDESVPLESGDRAAVYDGDAPLDVRNPTFDVTPPDLVDAVVTERGALSPDEVGDVAAELRRLADRASPNSR
ncbi:translation initiation factor eIF-2B [Halostella sp. JP-L12]|uniref:initiation factor 2B n=1 Tax=Halostella TaxID=1843185 RepID=UPI000EF80DF1|nr:MULTISPECIES: initiation factor 2B [Halostella]NHN48149.1 translation initiation factor eIF-2B [Halostella sp. JP-L12]